MKKDAAKDIKIAFFDVDGTLVDMEKKIISPKMIETLKRLKKNGIIYVLRQDEVHIWFRLFRELILMSF